MARAGCWSIVGLKRKCRRAFLSVDSRIICVVSAELSRPSRQQPLNAGPRLVHAVLNRTRASSGRSLLAVANRVIDGQRVDLRADLLKKSATHLRCANFAFIVIDAGHVHSHRVDHNRWQPLGDDMDRVDAFCQRSLTIFLRSDHRAWFISVLL